MKITLVHDYSKEQIECSVKDVREKETRTDYIMDSKNCNVFNTSQFDQESIDCKIASVTVFKSGKVICWGRGKTSRGNWTQGQQVISAELKTITL